MWYTEQCSKIVNDHLKHLSDHQLKDILKIKDFGTLNNIMNEFQVIKTLEKQKETLIELNKSIAENNMKSEPKYTSLRDQLLKSNEDVSKLRQSIETLQKQLCDKNKNLSADEIHNLLQAAACEAEEDSDNVANKFLQGDLGYDQFLEEFLPARKLSHQRRIKCEKIAEFILDQQRQAASHYHHKQMPTNSMAPSQSLSNLPYPVANPMPQPPYPANASRAGYPPMPQPIPPQSVAGGSALHGSMPSIYQPNSQYPFNQNSNYYNYK